MYQRGIIFSIDPQIHEFNKIFLAANPHLTYTDKDPNGIQTYDFVDKGDEQAGIIKSLMDLKNIFNLLPDKINTGINLVIVGVVGIVLLKVFQTVNAKKETTK